MSSDRRRGLGKGLGALIPSAPAGDRPSDVFFPRSQGDGFTGNRDKGMDPTLSEGAQDGPGLGTPPFLGYLTPVPGAHFAELPIDTIAYCDVAEARSGAPMHAVRRQRVIFPFAEAGLSRCDIAACARALGLQTDSADETGT